MSIIDERLLDVDRHGCTNMPGPILLGLVFLCRYIVIAVVVFASAKRSPDATRLLSTGFEWWFLALEVPAAILLWVYASRSPESKTWVRALWSRGARLIYAAVLAHLIAAACLLAQTKVWQPWPELFLVSCSLIDCLLAWRIRTDPFFKRLFSEFPKLKEPKPKEAS